MSTEVNFTCHCDEPGCDLGYAWYICPKCGKNTHDYMDLWWDRYEKAEIKTKCENCKEEFTAVKEEGGYIIRSGG